MAFFFASANTGTASSSTPPENVRATPPTVQGAISGAGGADLAATKAEKKDKLSVTAIPVSLSMLQHIRGAVRQGRGRKKQEEIALRLPIFGAFTTTAGTTYNTVIPVQPSNATEWSALTALYDEVICDGGDFMFVLGQELAYTTVLPTIDGVCYDPLSPAVITSSVNVAQHSQHFMWGQGISANVNNPVSMTKDGLHHLRFRTPKTTARTASVADGGAGTAAFGKEWASTSDTSDTWGFIKPYLKANGATGTQGCEWILMLHCRFRCRT
jgi:hypothetical protein